jgi:hypothetical protein
MEYLIRIPENKTLYSDKSNKNTEQYISGYPIITGWNKHNPTEEQKNNLNIFPEWHMNIFYKKSKIDDNNMLYKDNIINNPYNIINLILPDFYEKILYFKCNIIRKDYKKILRTLYDNRYLFHNHYFNDYSIFIYNDNEVSILYYINDSLYYKKLNINEKNILININNLELNYKPDIIKECIKTDKMIKIDYDNILRIYNKKQEYKILNVLLQHELKCLLDSEYRESYFEKITLMDETIPIYLPIQLELYFIMNELFNRTNVNNTTKNANIDTKEINNFLSNATTMYSILVNDNIETLNIDSNIINNAYIRYNDFLKEEKDLDNYIDKINHHNIYNLHMNSFRKIVDTITTNSFINKTYKKTIKTRNSKINIRRSTKKHRTTL